MLFDVNILGKQVEYHLETNRHLTPRFWRNPENGHDGLFRLTNSKKGGANSKETVAMFELFQLEPTLSNMSWVMDGITGLEELNIATGKTSLTAEFNSVFFDEDLQKACSGVSVLFPDVTSLQQYTIKLTSQVTGEWRCDTLIKLNAFVYWYKSMQKLKASGVLIIPRSEEIIPASPLLVSPYYHGHDPSPHVRPHKKQRFLIWDDSLLWTEMDSVDYQTGVEKYNYQVNKAFESVQLSLC